MDAHLVVISRVSVDGFINVIFYSCIVTKNSIVVGGLSMTPNDDQVDVDSSDGWLDSLSEIDSLSRSRP